VAINYLPAASALCSTVTTGHQGISANDLLTIVAFVCSLRHDFYTTLSNTSQGGLRRRLPGDPSIAILKRRSSVEAEVESVCTTPGALQVVSIPGYRSGCEKIGPDRLHWRQIEQTGDQRLGRTVPIDPSWKSVGEGVGKGISDSRCYSLIYLTIEYTHATNKGLGIFGNGWFTVIARHRARYAMIRLSAGSGLQNWNDVRCAGDVTILARLILPPADPTRPVPRR
jgi:hypothetical protein